MSFNVAMLEALEAEGLDLAACLRVLRAGEVRKDTTAAERQARHRDKIKAERDEVTRDVTRDDQVSFDKETTPIPPKKLNPSHVCETRARAWHRLPEGWRPKMPLPVEVQAKVDQWPPGTEADELAAFKRWAANAENKNGKGRKLDWDKAWWNWIGRRHDQHYQRPHGLGGHQPNDGLSSTARAALAVFGSTGPGH